MSKRNLSDDVLVALRKIIRSIDLHSKQLVRTVGLTGPQLLVLKEVLEYGPMPTGLLAKNVNLSHATVTSILDRLVKKGFIHRERDDKDKRKMVVCITSEGSEISKEAPTLLQEEFTTKFEGLEKWEQHLILSSLERVANMMDAKTIDAAPFLESMKNLSDKEI